MAKGFNIDTFRELNKFRLGYFGSSSEGTLSTKFASVRNFSLGDLSSPTASSSEETYLAYELATEEATSSVSETTQSSEGDDYGQIIYEAYCTSPFSFSAGINAEETLGSSIFNFDLNNLARRGGGLSKAGLFLAKHTNIALNGAVGIDIAQKNYYRGSKPLAFTVDTILYLRDDYTQDIATPLNNLFDFLLPSRGDSLNEQKDALQKKVNTWLTQQSDRTPALSSVWAIVQEVSDSIYDFVGDVFLLKPPKYLTHGENIFVALGENLIFDSMTVTNVSVDFSPLIYDKGYPAYAKVRLSVQSLRPATSTTLKF